MLSRPSKHTQAAEALRRAKFKFPGRQKVVASRNWGFTPYSRDDYMQWKKEGRLVNCGVHAQVLSAHCFLFFLFFSLFHSLKAIFHSFCLCGN